MRARPLLWVLSAGLGTACSSASTEFWPWPAGPNELFFLVSVQGDGRPELLGPFPSSDRPDETTATVEIAPQAELLALLYSRDALMDLHPRIDPSRLSGARLELTNESCEEGTIEEDTWLRLRLDQTAPRVLGTSSSNDWAAATLPDELTRALSLRLPYDDAAPCPGRRWRLSPFTTELAALPDGVVLDGRARSKADPSDGHEYFAWSSIAFLDQDRILASAYARFYLFHRGRAFDPANFYSLEAPLVAPRGSEVVLSGMVRDPTYDVPGRSRLLAVYATQSAELSPTAPRGALREIIFGPSGIEEVRTATRTEWSLRRIAIDASGRFVAAGDSGLVVTGHAERGIEEVFTLSIQDIAVDAVLTDPNGPYPFLVVSDASRVFGVTPGAGVEGSQLLGPELILVTSSANAAWPRPDAPAEIWMSTFGLGTRRRANGVWSGVRIPIPKSAEACGGTQQSCGRRGVEQTLGLMTPLTDGRLLISVGRCSALIALSPSLDCSEPITFSGQMPEGTSEPPFRLSATLGDLVAVAFDGRLALLSP